ncbi:XRE family transcriptional regulator [Nocardia sp. NPDC052001]|uniref:helix-turn-helix domain-containing protein n=1 Tax=Nocardia sp. NPDC052001 TaxID=3154853 RepID=UPI003435D118
MLRDEAELNRMIGRRLRSQREKAGMSMRELAQRVEVSQPFLSQLENGVSAPSMSTIYRLATALGVVPGDLLPPTAAAQVTVVRAGEGALLPVTDRPDAAVGRILVSQSSQALEVIEYHIQPGQYLQEWFESEGEMALYLIAGALEVQLDGVGSWQLEAGDLIHHPGAVRHRWLLVDDQPVHLVLTVSRTPRG